MGFTQDPPRQPHAGRRRAEIVVISELDDQHVPLVQPHLSRELIIVDALAHPLTFERGAGGGEVVFANRRRLADVRTVWYRKPLTLLRSLVALHVVPQHRRYARHAIGAHAEALEASFRDATWVSDVPAIIRAEHKPLQLLLAEDFGLRVPSTMITSDAEAATAFVESQPATVIKPLCSAALAGDVRHAFLAVRVHGTDGLAGELVNLKWAPAVFQRAIDAVADLRVTIVGDEVFVARLDVDREAIGQPGIRDWRIRQTDGLPPFEPDGTLSKQIRRACREMTRALGLKFSAIDLVVDVHGDVWFLELNPNGQWGFVELATGQPIGAAMAALLERDS